MTTWPPVTRMKEGHNDFRFNKPVVCRRAGGNGRKLLRDANVKPLQFFCQSMPLSFVIKERQLMFFSKLHRTDNTVLRTLVPVPMVKHEMLRLAVKYGLNDVRERLSTIRDTVWSCFVQKVQW